MTEKPVVIEKKAQSKSAIKGKISLDKEEKTPKTSNKKSVVNIPAVEISQVVEENLNNSIKQVENLKIEKDSNEQLVSRSGRKIKPKRLV